jgi:catechol 2,3-dioxygenase-like lactoylglutathione lyase family enzyme
MEPDTSIQGVGQVAIPARDLPAMVAFYHEMLGLPLMGQFGQLAFLDCGGVRLLLSGLAEEDGGVSILYYRVSNIETAVAALRQKGVVFEDEPHMIAEAFGKENWMAFCRDVEGNLLGLMEERELAGEA